MISLPEKYYLVVNDRFELFFRGVIKKHNPYQYYVKAYCEKGYTYNRYFTYTPKEDEVGEYPLSIIVYDDEGGIIEQKDTILVVNKPEKPLKKLNILCIGDSETVNGVWPYVGYQKFTSLFDNSLNFIGKMKKDEIGFEGYGGWQWKTFCGDETESRTSSVWVNCKHNLVASNVHSVWVNNDLEWILETIKKDAVKFKRGNNNTTITNPKLADEFKLVFGNFAHDNLHVDAYEYSDANPFWNKQEKKLDFRKYLRDNNFEEPDIVFTFLTGNGLYIPYAKEFPIHEEYATKFLKELHETFPKALIGMMGIELPCCNGGVTACYGASGYYHDWYGDTITTFNYDEWLMTFVNTDYFKDFTYYFDIKSQFDSENSYPYVLEKVNNRSEITEKIGTNGLHPSLNGYKQIGDAFYRFLVEMVKKYNRRNK